MQAELYKEDFESERRDREVAHGKFADLQKKYVYDVGELKAELAQMKENLNHHQDRLAEVEQVNHRRAMEMKSLLEEVSKNQQEVQAKASQVKQQKKQVDSLKEQVCLLNPVLLDTLVSLTCFVHQETHVFSNQLFSF